MDWPAAVEEKFAKWLESPHILGGDSAGDYEPFHHFVWSLVEHGVKPDYDAIRFEMNKRLSHRYTEHRLEQIIYPGATRIQLLLWFIEAHPNGRDAVRQALYK